MVDINNGTSIEDSTKVCGDCKLCCKVYPMPIFNKPDKVWCQHAVGSGCGIYDQRPLICRDFVCVWLKSNLPEKYRPDKCGVIVRIAAELNGHYIYVVSESYDGAWLRKHAEELISILKESGGICIIVNGDRYCVRWDHERYPNIDPEEAVRSILPSGKEVERLKSLGAIEDVDWDNLKIHQVN
jgi:hypothetical protein